MRQSLLRTSRPRQLWGALLWAALLAGIFAMHGLGTHGTGGHHAMTQGLVPVASQPTVAAAIESTHHLTIATLGGDASSAGASPRPAVAGTSSSATLLLTMLCLAMLGGLLALCASQLFPRFVRRSRSASARLVPAYVAGRDRDPPCLVRLSVARC